MFDDIVVTFLLANALLVTGCATQEPSLETTFNRKSLESPSNGVTINSIQALRTDVKQLRKARKLSEKSYNTMMKDLAIVETRLNTLIKANKSLREKGFDWNP